MPAYPVTLQKAISNLKKIPGIGPKSAERIAFFLVSSSEGYISELSETILALKQKLNYCDNCFSLTDEKGLCSICANTTRERKTIIVVETFRDLLAIENMGEFKGLYHVLEGHLSPLDGVQPEHLRIRELLERIAKEGTEEVILATNPNVEGDATAFYISRQLKEKNIKVTRIAKGIPVGSDIEYADFLSLSNSIKNREKL